jgi:hypothetical protein
MTTRLQILSSDTQKTDVYGIPSFSSSRQLFEHLPEPLSVKLLSKCTFSTLSSPFERTTLITPHPTLGIPCLRYQTTQHGSIISNISNGDSSVFGIIDDLMYDRRVRYDHIWKDGDMVLNDPSSATYTCNDVLLGRAVLTGNGQRGYNYVEHE